MNKEIRPLTSIRGIAAIYVMLFHFFYINDVSSLSPLWKFLYTPLSNGYLSVDLFFFLSAFVMCIAYKTKFSSTLDWKDYKTFMIKRFARIYPVYFVFCFIYYILFGGTLSKLMLNLSLFQIFFDNKHYLVDVFWSLSAEWVLYLVFPIIFYFLNKIKNKIFWFGCLIFIPFLLFFLKYMNYIVLTNDGFVNLGFTTVGMARGLVAVIRCFFGYIIGIALFKIFDLIEKEQLRKIFKPIYLLPLGLSILFENSQMFIYIFFIFLIAICYIKNDEIKFLNGGLWYKLGLWSYSIYLVHRATKYVFVKLIDKFYSSAFSNDLIELITINGLAITTSIVISIFTYKFIEKYFNKKLLNWML